MISEDHKTELAGTGVAFLRCITNAYGTEDGMKLWDNIFASFDNEVKGAIFFAAINGHSGNKLTIRGVDEHSDRIARIKAIRTVSGLGLKEAKDISDRISNGSIEVIDIDMANGLWPANELRRVGFII